VPITRWAVTSPELNSSATGRRCRSGPGAACPSAWAAAGRR
jgi:hypothetical protein